MLYIRLLSLTLNNPSVAAFVYASLIILILLSLQLIVIMILFFSEKFSVTKILINNNIPGIY